MTDKQQVRRDTAANWTSVDPTLADGELGFETVTNRFKIGDGTTVWTALPYVWPQASYCELLTSTSGASGTSTRVYAFSEVVDTDGYFDVGNPSHIVAPWTGLYHLVYNIKFSNVSNSFYWDTKVNLNGAGSTTFDGNFVHSRTLGEWESQNAGQSAYNSTYLELTAGDYIEILLQTLVSRTIITTQGGAQMRFISP